MSKVSGNQGEGAGVRSPRLKWRWAVLTGLVVLLGAVLVGWRSMLPASPQAGGGPLSQRDQQQISQLCRRHTIRFAIDRLRGGQFAWFVHSAHVLFQQKIDRLIDDHDGTYRVYVVVPDPRAPDGFNPWFRHQMTQTNGHWTILRSY